MTARSRGLAAAVLFAVACCLPGSASGQGSPPTSAPPTPADTRPIWERIPDPRLSPGLVTMPVDSRAYRNAIAAWEQTLADLDETNRVIAESTATITTLGANRAAARDALEAARAELVTSLAEVDVLERSIDHLAVRRYVSGGVAVDAINLITAPDPGTEVYDRAIAEQLSDAQLTLRATTLDRADELDRAVAARTEELVAIGTALVETQATLDAATVRLAELTDLLPRREQAVRDRRMGATVTGTDLTLVALDAYVKAAAQVRDERSSCGMEWWMIAALGRIESRHGTIYGSEVRPNGQTSIRIIGIPLNGTRNTARIEDTDGGALDGDTEFDRAVGPMQFIPSTWETSRRDGNGDGDRDPHNLYDAATAAGAYLCARAGNVTSNDALRRAYLAYNRSSSYVETAIANGTTYRALALPSA
jgi:membrane-bound lytic murein transglycosylase B